MDADTDLTAEALQTLVERYKQVYERHGHAFPEEPRTQLRAAVAAVFESWQSERAVMYRKVNKIRGLVGTAVNVQARARA